jgi:hypothetical protein
VLLSLRIDADVVDWFKAVNDIVREKRSISPETAALVYRRRVDGFEITICEHRSDPVFFL